MEKNYYQLLGISINASEEEIRKAYYNLAKKFHPDRKTSDKSDTLGPEEFALITQAFNILKDPKKRKEYDEKLRKELELQKKIKLGEAKVTKPNSEIGGGQQQLARESYKKGLKELKNRNYVRAYYLFKTATEKDPNQAEYWSYLGYANILNKGKLSESVSWAMKAINMNPFNLDFKLNLAKIYLFTGAKTQARKYLEEIIKMDPKHKEANELLAEISEKNKKTESFISKILGILKR